MGTVVQLIQPIDRSTLIAALDEITDTTTEAVIIVTASPRQVSVRSFGRHGDCDEALSAARRHRYPTDDEIIDHMARRICGALGMDWDDDGHRHNAIEAARAATTAFP